MWFGTEVSVEGEEIGAYHCCKGERDDACQTGDPERVVTGDVDELNEKCWNIISDRVNLQATDVSRRDLERSNGFRTPLNCWNILIKHAISTLLPFCVGPPCNYSSC